MDGDSKMRKMRTSKKSDGPFASKTGGESRRGLFDVPVQLHSVFSALYGKGAKGLGNWSPK